MQTPEVNTMMNRKVGRWDKNKLYGKMEFSSKSCSWHTLAFLLQGQKEKVQIDGFREIT